ncbi:hypothetical protein HY772_00395 [Candidatus Woesearchaeota archaeon]|nr:hypothetical protein [Candidatus Woesearchaeota archaeon]
MKYVHSIAISAFSKVGEDIERIRSTLKDLALLDLEKEKLSFKDTIAKSHDDKDVHILEIMITKEGQVNRFLKAFIAKLSDDQRQLVIDQRGSRVDEDCRFFIRLDKRKLLEENRWWITDSGNCFHIKMALAAYPVRKEVGEGIVEELFRVASAQAKL